ncbi:MAG: divergent polysaccharide deacetylase family protein, partial [Solimonas sp.]
HKQGMLMKHGRPIVACLLGLCLIAANTTAFASDGDGSDVAASSRSPALEVPSKVVSLAVPSRPFRSFSPAELGEMIEVTDDGQRLPRIAPSGWMPWIAYARRFDQAGAVVRVGVLIINLGANEALTRRAIEELPAEVSLAFLPGAPDLARWLGEARERGHEVYLMLPAEDPSGPGERGLRPIQAAADAVENLRRLRAVMARGEGYVGFVAAPAGTIWQSEAAVRPLLKEMADRGLALIEIDTTPPAATMVQRLTEELGIGYARTNLVLDYKLSDGGLAANLDRLDTWGSRTQPEQPPRHRFAVVQPGDEAIDAIVAWTRRRPEQPVASLVPIIGHFECREACMTRLRVQPAQLRP